MMLWGKIHITKNMKGQVSAMCKFGLDFNGDGKISRGEEYLTYKMIFDRAHENDGEEETDYNDDDDDDDDFDVFCDDDDGSDDFGEDFDTGFDSGFDGGFGGDF